MDQTSLVALLNRLRAEPSETEWLEFKASPYIACQLGEYLSALANSACLHHKQRGYLVFGVEDSSHDIVGTKFDPRREKGKGNQDLLLWLASGLQPKGGFECHCFEVKGKRVVLFEIFPAFDQPIKFYGTAYIRIGSAKTELANHPEKERVIWQKHTDWSAQVCEHAKISELDPKAIRKARQEYATKFAAKVSEVEEWNDLTFLNKAGATIKGAVTNTAILLLGKPESAALIAPAIARMTWILKDERNTEKDYEHFDPPFILNVDRVLAKIRNLNVRQLPHGTLFPIELTQYDPWVIREALHNCVAHQDYTLSGRINLVELPDRLILTNAGSFLPGTVERVIQQDAPSEFYRNGFLARAMVNLNMIDTQGGGIKRMFQTQIKRYFPLPDYDLSDPARVVVALRGAILNEQYTKMLMERTDLELWAIILLDRIQKGIRIEPEEHRRLKKLGLVDGRYPNIFISAKIAAAIGQKARQIRFRGLNHQYYRDLIIELIRQHGPVPREEINRLLLDKLPEALTPDQKAMMIHNLLSDLRIKGAIKNAGSRRFPKWILS